MNAPDGQAYERLSAEISSSLRGGRREEAAERVGEVVRGQGSEALSQWLPELERLFGRDWSSAPPPEQRLAPLAELLWANKETALNDMYAVGYFMQFCNKSGIYDHFGPLLRSWIASDSTPDFTFSEHADLPYFRDLVPEQKRDFANAKYRRWKDFESQDFFHAVEGFSKFATVSSPLADFLFEHRCAKNLSFSEWMGALRSAETWKHILRDASVVGKLQRRNRRSSTPGHYPRLPELTDLVDGDRARLVFGGLDLSKGLLLGTIHHAHLGLARECATLYMPEHRMIARGQGENLISVRADGHLAAFKAIKALRDKKMLLMLPDARGGMRRGEVKDASEVTILGRPRLFANGAPTIAFESGCATGWYMVIREGDRFVPFYEPGPSREAKESFAAFKERWWAFYAGQVEKLFASDPHNSSLHHFWPRLFGSDVFGDDDEADDDAAM